MELYDINKRCSQVVGRAGPGGLDRVGREGAREGRGVGDVPVEAHQRLAVHLRPVLPLKPRGAPTAHDRSA